MRISHLHIPDWKHFQNFDLDLCYPADYKDPSKRGKPLDRVCFIGRNGTGKTNILDLLKEATENQLFRRFRKDDSKVIANIEYILQDNSVFINDFGKPFIGIDLLDFNPLALERPKYIPNVTKFVRKPEKNQQKPKKTKQEFWEENNRYYELEYSRTVLLRGDINFKNYFLTDEAAENEPKGFISPFDQREQTAIFSTLNAEKITKAFKDRFIRRAVLFAKFAKENQHKSYFELNQMVDEICPAYLEEIKDLWDNILQFAKLYLDIDNTKVPDIQNNEFAFLIKQIESQKEVKLADLSTGMREFMFKIGSLKLYYQEHFEYWRERKKEGEPNAQDTVPFTSLFMDEPENGLFVDMLYNYFDNYLNFVTPENTQLFVATHSPIIASQFEPEERIILYFDEAGNIRAKRGSAPIGDDVNDMMMQDFETEVFERQKDEIAAWQEYSKILLELPTVQDAVLRKQLIKRYLYLANLYHYPAKKADIEARSAEK